MRKLALRTDYKNDILDASMTSRRRYKIINNEDSTVSFVDQTVYTQKGDFLDADDLNSMNETINTLNDAGFVKSSEVTSIEDEEIIALFSSDSETNDKM